MCAALIFGLQVAGGAYHAEFNGHPDEAAQFVSGLMVRDYLAAWPPGHPIDWAVRYYIHYPKVAIGHWPPGFHVMEALWWLVLPPSRWSALLLNGLLALAAAALVYRLARTIAPSWMALCAALLLIAAPAMQQSFSLSMADAACLVWSVLVMAATVRLVKERSSAALNLVALWLICGLLTKGSVACLIPAVVLAPLIAGRWREVPRGRALGAAAAVVVLGLGWYGLELVLWRHDLQTLGGVRLSLPWRIDLLPGLAGYGILALACGGVAIAILRRRPAAVVAAAMLLSIAAGSFFIRALNESRHWMIALPALLILAVEFLMWLRERSRWGLLAAVPALLLFPFGLYRQQPLGVQELLSQVHLPSRMLVSSTAAGEGAWIVEVALAEKRPASVVVRATKALASSNWNGEDYHLIAQTPGEAATRLDELGIDTVVLCPEPGARPFPHQAVLAQALQIGDSWRVCAAARASTLYCRVKPAAVPRSPLRIDLTGAIGRIIEE